LHIHCHYDFELAVASIIGIEIDILSVVILAMVMLLWTAHPGCPEHAKPELERRVRSLPSSFLLPPVAGEVFVDADVCQESLQGWALLQGLPLPSFLLLLLLLRLLLRASPISPLVESPLPPPLWFIRLSKLPLTKKRTRRKKR
jgi:hypothetical protein